MKKLSTLISRKQFFEKTISKGLKTLIRLIDVDLLPSDKSVVNLPSKFQNITADFPPSLLKLEAQKLGLDPDSHSHDSLLRAVHEAMEKQHRLTEDDGSHL